MSLSSLLPGDCCGQTQRSHAPVGTMTPVIPLRVFAVAMEPGAGLRAGTTGGRGGRHSSRVLAFLVAQTCPPPNQGRFLGHQIVSLETQRVVSVGSS